MTPPRLGRSRGRRSVGPAIGVAAPLLAALLFASCSGGGGGAKKAQVDAIQAPAGTMRAVFFEHVAHCKRSAARASSAEPEVSCTIEIVGTSILEPDRAGRITINRQLEVDHDETDRTGAWDEQGVELVAYGPKGSASFATRGWHYADVWSPDKGPAKFVIDARATNTALPAAERHAFALEPMAAAIETLTEVPARMRLDLRPFVLDLATLLEALLVEPGLSDESRERITAHLALLDEAMRAWGVDWLASRAS
jgi:hypothetical protein